MRKINFNNRFGLTAAVADGTKTMNRRIATYEEVKKFNAGWLTEPDEAGTFVICDGCRIVARSQYKINEIVAVAQSYKDAGIDPHFLLLSNIKRSTTHAMMETEAMFTAGWNNKLFVRADLMPLRIKITGIKAERMQDISDKDCLREGIKYNREVGFEHGCYCFNDYEGFRTPRNAFATLINRINGKSTWEINPLVFAYTFEIVKQ